MTNESKKGQADDSKAGVRATVAGWLARPSAAWIILAVILLVAALLRLTNLNWDDGTHIHPDERFLTMVSSAMQLPASLGEFFDSTSSPMSPYNKGFGFFVYGTLPLFIVRVAAEFARSSTRAPSCGPSRPASR